MISDYYLLYAVSAGIKIVYKIIFIHLTAEIFLQK